MAEQNDPSDDRSHDPVEGALNEANREHLVAEYAEVCQTHRMLSDFRAKLLALLPIASGTGIYLLLAKQNEPVTAAHVIAVAVFGFTVTLGLFIHELRTIKHCTDLIRRGARIERALKLGGGQFTDEAYYYSSRFRDLIGPVGSAWLIYPAILAAWLYLAAAGTRSDPNTNPTVREDGPAFLHRE